MPVTSLRTVFFAGEVFPTKHLNYWIIQNPKTAFVNLWGPIETTIDSTYFIVDRDFQDNEPIPIGLPCKNTDILILDEEDELIISQNKLGELCVRGSSLALGYYNNDEQTLKAFTQNPLNHSYPDKIYRTGDLGYLNENNEIMFGGRKDFQIKHQGYRIELSEIETAFLSLPEIYNACALYNKDLKEIIIIYEAECELSPLDLRQQALAMIPKYMLPTKFYLRESLPRNPNGKIDRKFLSREYL
ncbi:MAG: AMP-binding protein [Gammaproteobacteria bacterium]|nr:AMP-binding protein [Gammaproteobacteria bacterium]